MNSTDNAEVFRRFVESRTTPPNRAQLHDARSNVSPPDERTTGELFAEYMERLSAAQSGRRALDLDQDHGNLDENHDKAPQPEGLDPLGFLGMLRR